MFRPLLGVLLAATLSAAPPLEQRLMSIIDAHPLIARASWGMYAVEAATGKVLFRWNDERWFVPASNTKLYATALALTRLGPAYRFRTEVRAAALPVDGRLAGDLALVGGGDPTLSGRVLPYDRKAKPGDPLAAIAQLADAVAAQGVRRIDGDIVGDDTRYVWDPYPPGWSGDDQTWEYGAPVSALTLNDNSFDLTLAPGEPGEPARVSLNPPLEYFVIDNRVVTTAHGRTRIQVDRAAGARQVTVRGVIHARSTGRTESLAVDDPAEFAAYALYQALADRGIAIAGRPVARHRQEGQPRADLPPALLAQRESPPLAEILTVINKVSQNLEAELVVRETGLARRGEGTRQAGLEELRAMLAELGVKPEDYRFQDGSGLSRLTLTTPANTVRLLRHLFQGPHRDLWMATLPIAGQDGTLERRFAKLQPGLLRAKTGTLTGANALGGYAGNPRHGAIAFCIMVNNTALANGEARAFIDKIAVALTE